MHGDGIRVKCKTCKNFKVEYWTQFNENVLTRTVLNAGYFLWMAKRVIHLTSVSTTLWTSRWSKGKVH